MAGFFPNTTAMPGPTDVYIPNLNDGKAQARLIVSYARDPKRFAVNRLVTRTPTQNLSGFWLALRPESLARIFQYPNNYIWVDGQPFPTGNHNAQDFRSVAFQCYRVAMPDYLGEQTREQAVWPIEETKIDALGHMMMTLRASVFYSLVLNPVNHLSTHVGTSAYWSGLNGQSGGGWGQGTADNPIIKRSVLNLANQIRKDSLATVNYKDLAVVIDPDAAIIAGSSTEMHSFLARSQYAGPQLKGEGDLNSDWGMPNKLYGLELIVDPTLQTLTSRMVVPGSYADIMNYNTALIIALPGALGSNVGQVNSRFSSVHQFVYRGQEMVTKTKYLDWDQFTKLGIYETYGMSIVSPETTGLITSLFF